MLLITGEIPRQTNFEKGYPFQYVEKKDDRNNEKILVPDPMVKDDQAIVASIRDKGLVIMQIE